MSMPTDYNASTDYGKGMGWIPDAPDERDYDLYDEIYEKYGNVEDKASALQNIHSILEEIFKEENIKNRDIEERLDNLYKKLNKFDFIKTQIHKILRKGDKDKRVLLLKTSLVYFYQTQVDIRRSVANEKQQQNIREILEKIRNYYKDKESEKSPEEENKLDKELKLGLAYEALRGITHSIVDGIGNEESTSPEIEKVKEELGGNKISLIDHTKREDYYACDVCDVSEHGDNARLESERHKKLKEVKALSGQDILLVSDDANYYPLEFLKDSEKYWKWIKNSEFCLVVEALVKGFQTWARYKVCSVKAKNGQDYEKAISSTEEELPCEYVKPDGIFGINTYSAFKTWLVDPSLEQIEKPGHAEKPYELIPFPSSVPSEVLEVIINKFQAKLLAEPASVSLPGRMFDKVKDIVSHSSNLVEVEVTPFSEPENRKAMLWLSRKHFFEIEPVISIVFQILGALGAYPKTLETALELSIEIFWLLLNVTPKEIDNIEESSLYQIAAGKDKQLSFVEGMPFNKYLALGDRDELSERYFLKLQGDIDNLRRLKALVTESLQVCLKRLNIVSKTIITVSGSSSTLESKGGSQLEPEEKLILSIQAIITQLIIKDKTKPSSSSLNTKRNGRDFNASIVFEFYSLDSNDKKKAVIESDEKLYSNMSVSLEDRENDIYQPLFSSYVVPAGEDFLENVRDFKKTDKLSCNRHFSYLPKFVDLSFWCSKITNQGNLQSCSAQAGASLIEYFSQRYIGGGKPVSRRFLYKTARNLEQTSGDTGTSLRATIKAMVLFGTPPEAHWNYDESKFDEEPTAFCYSFGQNYQTLSYFRLDHPNVSKEDLLVRIKIALASGFPCMFGFTSYESIHDEFNAQQGYIPYPGHSERMLYRGQFNQSLSRQDKPIGSHALVAVGYNDLKSIRYSNNPKKFSEGALLVRNSWGVKWGLNGYGWLPYDYVLKGQTADWWSLLKSEWLESGKFGLGGAKGSGGKDSNKPSKR